MMIEAGEQKSDFHHLEGARVMRDLNGLERLTSEQYLDRIIEE